MNNRSEWESFNPMMEDRRVKSIDDAVELAGKLKAFGAYLRDVDQTTIATEFKRFFDDGFIGPITSTIRKISPSLRMMQQHNSTTLFERLSDQPDVNSIFLALLLNEFYFPIDERMPIYYAPIEIVYIGHPYKMGVVDRIRFAKEIKIESVLIEAEIVKSHKHRYHLDDEFSIYDIEYSYRWNDTTYTNADIVKLNTAHLGWANRGGLRNFPKVDFDEKDLDEKLSAGTKINVYVANDNGQIRNPVYDDLVYEVAKM